MTMADLPFDPASVTSEEIEDAAPQRTRKTRSDAGVKRGPRDGTTSTRRVSSSKLAEELVDPLAKLAYGLAFVSPTAAAVIIARGEKTAKALVSVAEGHPKMLAALKRVSKVGPGTELAELVVALLIAIQLDAERIKPENPLAVITGVSELYRKAHPSSDESGQPSAPNVTRFPPPPGFNSQTVGINDPTHPLYAFRAGPGATSRAADSA